MQSKPSTIDLPAAQTRPILRSGKPDGLSPDALVEPGEPATALFRSAVACMDHSANAPLVFRHATSVANGLDIPVKLAHVIESVASQASPSDPIEWQIRMREAQDYLSRISRSDSRSLMEMDRLLLNGVAGEEISRWTGDNADDLIVMTTRCGLVGDRPGTSPHDMALGRTAQTVLDRTVASLLLVPPGESVEADVVYRRLVVPLDGSWRAESVLPFAVRIARKHGAELLLAHVIPQPELVTAGMDDAQLSDFVDKLNRCNEQNARAYLDRLQSRLASDGIAVRAIVEREGDVRERLLNLAERHEADLIVMSARGKGAIHSMSCGNVARHIAGYTRWPLLLIRQQMSQTAAHPAMPDQRYGPRMFWESAH